MDLDANIGSESFVRLIGMGSVSGLKSFLALVDWEGLGEGDEDILSLREKSSGSASGVGRGTTTYCCFRGEEGDCLEATEATGFGFVFCCILSDLSLGRVELKWVRFKRALKAIVTTYPAVLLRSAVSFSSRSVGWRSFCGFLEGICLCSESTCILNNERETAQSTTLSANSIFASAAVVKHVTVLRA